MDVGPHLCACLHSMFAGHPKGALRSTATAGFDHHIESDKVEMRVVPVVALLVMDRGHISGDATCQAFSEGSH